MSDTVLPTPQGLTKPSDSTLDTLLDSFDMFKDALMSSPLINEIKLLREATASNTGATEDNTETEEETTDERGKQNTFFSNLFSKVGDSFSSIGAKFGSVAEKTSENVTDATATALLGPLQLLTNPLEEFTGFSIKDSMSGLIKAPFKGNPKRSKVLPDDPGSVYLGDILLKIFGKEGATKEDSGFLGTLAGSSLGKLNLSSIAKGGAISAIAGGLIWAAVDGIRGFFASKKWGVSKVAGGLGGMLGGMDSGMKGAFKNMGKWALVGAGTGFLVGGPVGAIAGGLIGGALGGILGFIGGERIAKGLDKAFSWMNEMFDKVLTGISGIGDTVKGKFESFKTKHPMIGKTIEHFWRHSVFGSLMESIHNTSKVMKDKEKTFLQKTKEISIQFFHATTMGVFRKDSFLMKGINYLNKKVLPKIIAGTKQAMAFITDPTQSIKEKFDTIFVNIREWIGSITDSIIGAFTVGKDFILDKLDFLTPIKNNIVNAFKNSKDWIIEKFDFITPIIDTIKESMNKAFSGITNFFGNISSIWGEDKLGPIAKLEALGRFSVGDQKGLEKLYEKKGADISTLKGFDTQDTMTNIAESDKAKEKLEQDRLALEKEKLQLTKELLKTTKEKDNKPIVNVQTPQKEEELQKRSLWDKITGRD